VPPVEIPPPPSQRKYWTRCGAAEWPVERPAEDPPTLDGIDQGFSSPLRCSAHCSHLVGFHQQAPDISGT
jgi:hypothetical protein